MQSWPLFSAKVNFFTLSSNVVYQFLCSCDTNLSSVGMSLRHLGTRAREHLNLADINTKSAIKNH